MVPRQWHTQKKRIKERKYLFWMCYSVGNESISATVLGILTLKGIIKTNQWNFAVFGTKVFLIWERSWERGCQDGMKIVAAERVKEYSCAGEPICSTTCKRSISVGGVASQISSTPDSWGGENHAFWLSPCITKTVKWESSTSLWPLELLSS
jgi:hypothetical protein